MRKIFAVPQASTNYNIAIVILRLVAGIAMMQHGWGKIQNPLGWKKFSELAQETKLPVYALGGLGKEDLSEAEKNGAYGIAGISKFWSY